MPGGPGKFSFVLWKVPVALHTHRAAEAEQELLQQLHGRVLFVECTESRASTRSVLSALIQVL